MGVSRDHLESLYAETDDPWDFRGSPYERTRLAAVEAALPGPLFGHALELGCGNGELARRVAPRCRAYTGLDAVETALAAACRAVPGARFVRGLLPCPLPSPDPLPCDLVILSEVLYFLDHGQIDALAGLLRLGCPRAPVLCVIWLGPTGDQLSGEDALDSFERAVGRAREMLHDGPSSRIDLMGSA